MTFRLRLGRYVLPVIPLMAFLALWAYADATMDISPTKWPPLGRTVETGRELLMDGTLFDAGWASMKRFLIASVIGTTAGVGVGLVMARSRRVSDFLTPLTVFTQAIAGIAWIPLAIVWFGFGNGPVVFVAANAVFFVVLLNTISGVRSMPERLEDAGRVLGGSPHQIAREITVPGALAYVLVGLEQALAFAWRALISAEIVVASSGLGFLTLNASRNFDSATVLVGIFTIGVTWLIVERLVLKPLRRRTVERWGMVQTRPRL